MPLHSLALRNFRCFERQDFDFHSRANIIIGPNGSGKTSLLEAVYLLSSLRSLRSPTIRDLIRKNCPAFSVRGAIGEADVIHVAYGLRERVVEINGVAQPSRRALQEAFRTISVTEDDMGLVQGYPEVRRTFVDTIGTQLNDTYREAILRAHHLHRQRTALFTRTGRPALHDIEIWTEQVWQSAGAIRAMRQEVVTKLSTQLNILLHAIDPLLPPVEVAYHMNNMETAVPSWDVWITTYGEREIRMRRSLLGPQSDDIDIIIAEQGARRFASRGMQKLLLILLKLAQVHIVGPSTLLLDDLMADFDDERLSLVCKALRHVEGQIVITTPRQPDAAMLQFIDTYNGIKISL